MHGDDVSTLQFVGRKLIVFRALEVLVVERVAQAELAASTIRLGIERLVAIDCSQGVGELRTDDVATDGFLDLDVDDVPLKQKHKDAFY